MLGPIRLPGDGDLYWQRWLGEIVLQTHRLPAALGPETFAANGAPWVPQEWLFSILVAASLDHGLFFAFSVLVSAIPLAILCTIVARARPPADAQSVGLALLFSGMAFAESFGVRAQDAGWLLFAIFLLCVERDDGWYYAAVPATIAWANVHASVVLAPIVVAARLAAAGADGGLRSLLRSRDLALLPLVALATCCTPLGYRLPLYAFQLADSPIRHFIREWQPVNFSDTGFIVGDVPLAIAILLGGAATLRERKTSLFPAILMLVISVLAARNIPLFAIAAAPLAAVGFRARFPQIGPFFDRRRYLEPVALGGVVVTVLLAAVSVVQAQRTQPQRLPVAAIAALAATPGDHRLFCEDFTWCSVALNYPDLRVFMDGRCDPFPLPVWREYIQALDRRRAAGRLFARYDVNAVVALRDGNLAGWLRDDPRWTVSFNDGRYEVFRRD